ncbi:acyl-CoA thioesterase [Sporolactobacillus inulinus]|jgi:acyl-CoA hydrolase|uniref:Acyl-CoA hydrolase n=2 Tax=Sporolactobacillus inulinus TaxID=2078 RepID=A0A4Y1ZGT6_9BACL|nr:acyl-CoA thioesterase [Sporolactobacillus inulinus]KLI03918.1 acyl-CoA hydrolase [Sporolactobacillus inulinus CASD]GAY77688.1 acyl-CoA hydrolase [Sporolactobacillus inulinus]GEB76966.1 putative acyl-CoA thioester hydrolase YkhA [Sporolactobacillus inulinus]
MEAKRARDSFAVLSSQVMPNDTNNHGTLFGGKLMMYVDNIAAIAANRHARELVVTASIDSVDFLRPIDTQSSVCLEAFVTWTHNTSMEVFVKVIAENLRTGVRMLCTTCFLTFVALDDQGKPTIVPKIIPESEEEKMLYSSAEKRYTQRKNRRGQAKAFTERLSLNKPWA